MESNLGRSICKVIELVRGLHPDYLNEPVSSLEELEKERSIANGHQPSKAADYIVHVFRWKGCELFSAIQQFRDTCGKLLEGEVNFEKFMEDFASNLSLILNNHSEYDKRPELGDDLQQAQKSISSLQTELITLRKSKRRVEDQIENIKLINEDLDTQLTVSNAKVNEDLQKQSSFEVELQDKNNRCKELVGTCLELQLLLESITHKETPEDNAEKEGSLLLTGWEINAAIIKLEECQDTIVQLGNQLKGLASSNDHKMKRRLSLLNRMRCDDTNEEDKTSMRKEITSTVKRNKPALLRPADLRSIAPVKKQGGRASFLKKLLMRRKEGSSHKPLISLHV